MRRVLLWLTGLIPVVAAAARPPALHPMQTLWFKAHGMTFLACAKIGPKAARGDLRALAAIIRSLR